MSIGNILLVGKFGMVYRMNLIKIFFKTISEENANIIKKNPERFPTLYKIYKESVKEVKQNALFQSNEVIVFDLKKDSIWFNGFQMGALEATRDKVWLHFSGTHLIVDKYKLAEGPWGKEFKKSLRTIANEIIDIGNFKKEKVKLKKKTQITDPSLSEKYTEYLNNKNSGE